MKQKVYGASGIDEILATDEYSSMPITVSAPENGTVVYAGTPLTKSGRVTTGEGAYGILVYNVDTSKNANGAIIRYGVLDSAKAQQISGVIYNKAALKLSLPGIILRGNISSQDDYVVGTAIVGIAKVRGKR